MVIGYLAVQTGSLVAVHPVPRDPQLAAVADSGAGAVAVEADPKMSLARLPVAGDEPLLYHPATSWLCVRVGVAAILWWLHGTSYRRTAEEQLEEARQQQDSALVGAGHCSDAVT